ncbi:MAG: His-Xaa-Ser system radical SAM maturase HxsB [Robiginitomaculum sp.]|nr:MAG: His-Xaa-Ser system radical SAM maturase HxsB [Robiginitomaculum sp.]
MSSVFPLRFRRLSESSLVFANEAGQFFKSNDRFLERLDNEKLTKSDQEFLFDHAMASRRAGDINEMSYLHRLASRLRPPTDLSYVILVPTLRCDLACSYCQVSRAAINAKGFDWSDETLLNVKSYLSKSVSKRIQVEFQGGEPTLRLDLMSQIMDFCREHFEESRFIICTNLSVVNEAFVDIISAEDVFVSSSLDGSPDLHRKQRTNTKSQTDEFFKNFSRVGELIGDRLSALPTLDSKNLPAPSDFLDTFDHYNMRSVFLRPVVYHGFARKRHPTSKDHQSVWQKFYEACIYEMIARNIGETSDFYEEYYLTLILKRLLRPGEDNHIDLRSPNWLGYDHQLIDYDGRIYPSDEARMMARTGQVDLSIGDVFAGLDEEKRGALQGRAFNALDPWCSQCPYQAACGSDPIDDLARHGRADVPKPATAYCQKHLHIFDFAMKLIYSEDKKNQHSLALWLGLPSPIFLGDVLQ